MTASEPCTVRRADPTLPPWSRVLVTGAGGFIGTVLCRELARSGVRVTGSVRALPDTGDDGVERIAVDLSRREDCASLLDHVRPDCVFHLASLVTGKRGVDVVPGTFDANLASSVYLMETAATLGTSRFVLAGSLEEPHGDDVPRSAYAASKAAARLYAAFFANSGALDVRHARIAMAYGPGQPDRTKLVPHTIDALLEGRVPSLSSGTRRADWTHVDDVVRALLMLATADTSGGGLPPGGVEIGTGELSSVRLVVEHLARLDARGATPHFGALEDRSHECDRAADAVATLRAIGWRSSIGLARGLAHTWHAEGCARSPYGAPPVAARQAVPLQTTTGSMVRATP